MDLGVAFEKNQLSGGTARVDDYPNTQVKVVCVFFHVDFLLELLLGVNTHPFHYGIFFAHLCTTVKRQDMLRHVYQSHEAWQQIRHIGIDTQD